MIDRETIVANLCKPVVYGFLLLGLFSSVVAKPDVPMGQEKTTAGRLYGKVIQSMDAAGYTYAEVDTGKQKVWAASRKILLNKGDMIAFSTAMPMENYFSKTLNRTFPVVYFTNQFITDKVSATGSQPSPHASMNSPHASIKGQFSAVPVTGIKKAEKGYDIAEIYNQKQNLKDKTVRVRGKVVKFTKNVMGKNWLHIMDGSSHSDLTVTTQETASVGEVVIIEGILDLDKDFNYGYVYPLIVENAKLSR